MQDSSISCPELQKAKEDYAGEAWSQAKDALNACPEELREGIEWFALHAKVRSALGECLDRLLLDVRARLLARSEAGDAEKATLFHLLASGYGTKRVLSLALDNIKKAQELEPENARHFALEGGIHLFFDDRERALAPSEAAYRRDSEGWGALALARYHFVLGNFSKASELLVACVRKDCELAVLRLRLSLANATGEYEKARTLLESILQRTPNGHRRRFDLCELGIIQYTLGASEQALEAWSIVWRENADDAPGVQARFFMDSHENTQGKGRRLQLSAFPTIVQKYDFCGPASMELLLRYFQVEADQDAIAKLVMRDTGTPLYLMTEYFRELGFETRYFSANPHTLCACIASQVPVILHEEHSRSSHVSVVVGFDERLDCVILQDPSNHERRYRRWKSQQSIGELFRNAALAVFPASAREIAAQLDDAGVIDLEYMRLFNAISNPSIDEDPLQVLDLCDQVLDMEKDYPLAHRRRLDALLNLAHGPEHAKYAERFMQELCLVRCTYIGWEFAHELHAHFLLKQNRLLEAIIEFEEAAVRDTGDANHPERQAACWLELGNYAKAEEKLWVALRLDPTHKQATLDGAWYHLEIDDLEAASHFAECAALMAPENPSCHRALIELATRQGRWEDALATARTLVALSPDQARDRISLGQVLEKLGEQDPAHREEALATYQACFERWPELPDAAIHAAKLAEAAKDYVSAFAWLRKAAETAPEDQLGSLLRNITQVADRRGLHRSGTKALEEIIERRPIEDAYEDYLDCLDELDAGSQALAFLMALDPTLSVVRYSLPGRLAASGCTDEERVERLFREALAEWPDDETLLKQYGDWLAVKDPASALALFNSCESSPFVDLQKAVHLVELEQFDEAWHLLEALAINDCTIQHYYNRATIGKCGGVEEAKAFVSSLDPLEKHHFRTLFALFASQGRIDEALACCKNVPDEDWTIMSMLKNAQLQHSGLREEFARRRKGSGERIGSSYAKKVANAVMAGFRASDGFPEDLEALLQSEESLDILAAAAESLTFSRDAQVLDRLDGALAQKKEAEYLSVLCQGCLQGRQGRLREAIQSALEALRSKPSCIASLELVMCCSLLLLELDTALDYALKTDYAREGLPWVDEAAVQGLVSFMKGDLPSAANRKRHIEMLLEGDGLSGSRYPLYVSLSAALEGRREGVEQARSMQGDNFYAPEAPFWDALLEKIGDAERRRQG
ncbi:MAG: tetratricopeptide repeat protein [Myxococcota bacterium]|nr:tetratricopeptide repeat protein [Myxococcota bacterium]